MKKMMTRCSAITSLIAGCGSETSAGSGDLTVVLEAEDTIVHGLDSGNDDDDIRDGWQVRYEKFIVTVGEVELHHSTDEGVERHADELFVVDLARVPASGLALWKLQDLPAGRWEFHYAISGAAHGPDRHDSVSREDFDEMADSDATYLIDGTLTKAEGRSCPPPDLVAPGLQTSEGENAAGHPCYANPTLRFRFVANAETVFGPCEIDGVPGVSIPSGGTQAVAATLHGDHLFFNGFPTGDEGGITRLAQWLADSDLDLNGEVERDELERIPRSSLGELDERYQWTGAPSEIQDMWDFVVAQLKTQGHMDGEGECPIDGVPHDH